jgi:hypothetical protein
MHEWHHSLHCIIVRSLFELHARNMIIVCDICIFGNEHAMHNTRERERETISNKTRPYTPHSSIQDTSQRVSALCTGAP